MKKILVLLLLVVALTGCSLGNMGMTPTKKVESYLNNYQKLDSNALHDIDTLINDTEYTVEQKARYKEIMKKHYKDMKYEIGKETIDGKSATVEVKITVTDYSNIINNVVNENDYKNADGVYDPSLYYDYQLGLLETASNKATYNVTFNLEKNDKEWVINKLSDNDMKKINGIYRD